MNKNFEPIFSQNLRTCKKGSNLENLRTTEPQKNLLVLIKKKCVTPHNYRNKHYDLQTVDFI